MTGKFFYADLARAEYYGLHYVEMELGSDGQKMQLSLDSGQFYTGVFEDICTVAAAGGACQIKNLWDYKKSTTAESQGLLFSNEQYVFGQAQNLVNNTITAIAYKDNFRFELGSS